MKMIMIPIRSIVRKFAKIHKMFHGTLIVKNHIFFKIPIFHYKMKENKPTVCGLEYGIHVKLMGYHF
jgi:hypothetical protein